MDKLFSKLHLILCVWVCACTHTYAWGNQRTASPSSEFVGYGNWPPAVKPASQVPSPIEPDFCYCWLVWFLLLFWDRVLYDWSQTCYADKDDLKFWSSSLHLWEAKIQVYITMLGLHGAEDQFQGSMHARQALWATSPAPDRLFFSTGQALKWK